MVKFAAVMMAIERVPIPLVRSAQDIAMLGLRLFVVLVFFALVSSWLAPLQAQSDRDRPKAEIVLRSEHGGWSGAVDSVAMSHNERWGLTGGDSVKVWEIETGRLIRTLEAADLGIVRAIVVSSDDKHVVAAGNHAVMWNIETGVVVREFRGNKSDLRSIKLSPTGNLIIAGENDNGFLSVWDTASGSLVKRFKAHGGAVAALAVAQDGRTFFTADTDPILGSGKPDGKIRRWSLADFSLSRTYEAGGSKTHAIAVTSDGRHVLAAGNDEKIHIWDADAGSLLRSLQDGEFKNGNRAYKGLSITADNKTILAAGYDKRLQLWDLAQGKLLNSFDTRQSISDLAASASGRTVLLSPGAFAKWVGVFDTKAGKYVGGLARGNAEWLNGAVTSADFRYIYYTTQEGIVAQIDLRSGQRRTLWKPDGSGFASMSGLSISIDGRHMAARVNDVGLLVDTATGSVGFLESEFLSSSTVLGSATVFTSDGKRVVLSSGANLSIYDVATRSHLRDLFVVKPKFNADGEDKSDQITSKVQSDGIAITQDGRTIASSHFDGRVRIWDMQTGKLLRTIVAARGWYGPGEEDRDELGPILMLPDGRTVAVSVNFGRSNKSPDPIRLFDIGTGRQIGELKDEDAPYSAMSMALSVDGTRLVAGQFNGSISVWDLKTRKLINQKRPHRGYTAVSIHKDQRTVLSASADGTINIALIDTGESVARILMDDKDQWVAATRHGFITASSRDVFRLASVVRGMQTHSILQVYDSAYNPDLVMEALAGDPGGEVKRAVERFSLDRLLDSGTPPSVKVSTRTLSGHTPFENGNVTAEVDDKGGGVGRVEWRVNGVIAGVDYPSVAKGGRVSVVRKLNFDAGSNKIEVRAYNGTNQLASTAAFAEINSLRLLPAGKPRLHILAIGINNYEDKGGDGFKGFEPLLLAVSDANAVGAELARAGRELYAGDVNVVVLTDRDATRSGIATTVERMAKDIHPRDTFILFAAAHGISPDGRFYLIPQDYQGGASPASLKERAIGQDLLQDWLANKIRAKRAVVLLDTCASGALVSGHLRSRLEAGASDAGVGRLHEATGRAVLTAAAEGRPAWEGHEGRGLFTHALLEALRKGDANKDGIVSLSELAAHIQTTVPRLAAGAGSRGEIREARVVARFAGTSSAEKLEQSSRYGSRGEDFPLAKVLP